MPESTNETLVTLTADIVSAHTAHNTVSPTELPRMIEAVFTALSGLGVETAVKEAPVPAVPVRTSVKPDFIVCLEDGKKLKMLKRHLMTHYQLTPEAYRSKWNLPSDYPMVAPNYAEQRRALAKSFGLGLKPGAKVAPRKKGAARR